MEETINVYWNSNIYRLYGKALNIKLWERERTIIYGFYEDRLGREILTGSTIEVDEENKVLKIGGAKYDFDSVIMEIPMEIFDIFTGLTPYSSFPSYLSSNSSSGSWIYKTYSPF